MNIFLTGASGTMGLATLKKLSTDHPEARITLLLRDSKKNRKVIKPFLNNPHISMIWGDLRDAKAVEQGVRNAEIVLHVGGMVSPKADYHPQATLDVNITAMKNIADAASSLPIERQPAVVYIGSVSQYGPREAPQHWCRTGDPMMPADHDMYALSKIKAERILAESGLLHWVSLRQTGILYPALLFNGTDPITFHVPLAGVLEWVTVEESAALLSNFCRKFGNNSLPESFWRKFYNIGGGEKYRLTNYQFEQQLLKALSCPQPEKIFNTNWFATRNFHGAWFSDSDLLEEYIPFRGDMNPDEYFNFMASSLPAYFKLAGVVPPDLIKWGMKQIAKKGELGPLGWFRDGNEIKIHSYFKSREDYAKIPDWDNFPLTPPEHTPSFLSHGYDESKPLSELDINDMRKAAEYRGGKCLSETMQPGDLYSPLEWECAFGHRFQCSRATILLGGHWCEECLGDSANYPREASVNPFMAQAWRSTHSEDELIPYNRK